MSYFKDMEKRPERKHRGVSGNGYVALLAAVAEQAVDDLVNLRLPKKPKHPKGSKQEKDWLKRCNELRLYQTSAKIYIFGNSADDENNVFGFGSIMKMINVSPDRARAAIKERMAEAIKRNKGEKE